MNREETHLAVVPTDLARFAFWAFPFCRLYPVKNMAYIETR